MSIRPVKQLIKAKPTIEGAGVHLKRSCNSSASFPRFPLRFR